MWKWIWNLIQQLVQRAIYKLKILNKNLVLKTENYEVIFQFLWSMQGLSTLKFDKMLIIFNMIQKYSIYMKTHLKLSHFQKIQFKFQTHLSMR
jgi:hypothetical protein